MFLVLICKDVLKHQALELCLSFMRRKNEDNTKAVTGRAQGRAQLVQEHCLQNASPVSPRLIEEGSCRIGDAENRGLR